MDLRARPWSREFLARSSAFGPNDCLLGEFEGKPPTGQEYVVIMNGAVRGRDINLALFPYPKRDHASNPDRTGFPLRPRKGNDPSSPEEEAGAAALQRMNEVLARIQELEEALDDPDETWNRLRAAWKRAENEADPRMAEIVRQARNLHPVLRDLITRIRRVLRRHRELTPLDRVREMDRASMIWLSRQPGRNIPERAGSSQRILATVRKENFDTLENRVVHSYSRLASDVAREWMREHPRAKESQRYRDVAVFRKTCRSIRALMTELDVSRADAGITPNYVLMQDRSYHSVLEAWEKLLRRRKIEDDLWAWQAEAWTDFAVLAITLAIDELEEAQLIAQSPIFWRAEAVTGRWFEQDRPIAVFWLRDTNRIVEIQARPEKPGSTLTAARANVALRITDPNRAEIPRRVAVWTPHAMEQVDISNAAQDAARLLHELQPLATQEVLRHGLILTPAHGEAAVVNETKARVQVQAVSLGASGTALAGGLDAVRAFVKGEIYQDHP